MGASLSEDDGVALPESLASRDDAMANSYGSPAQPSTDGIIQVSFALMTTFRLGIYAPDALGPGDGNLAFGMSPG